MSDEGNNKEVFFLAVYGTLKEDFPNYFYYLHPKKPIFGATRLTFNDEGKIIEQRDYYDLWGDIYDGIPIFR